VTLDKMVYYTAFRPKISQALSGIGNLSTV
jgi:hypothetical protein